MGLAVEAEVLSELTALKFERGRGRRFWSIWEPPSSLLVNFRRFLFSDPGRCRGTHCPADGRAAGDGRGTTGERSSGQLSEKNKPEPEMCAIMVFHEVREKFYQKIAFWRYHSIFEFAKCLE
jgi:hypothetical protein